jgi:choline kinase
MLSPVHMKTAVILAAGDGRRLQAEKSSEINKPLLKVGGLHLIERSILTLRASGIQSFRVVVGYKRDSLMSAMRKLKSLAEIDIQFIECEDFEKGNGASLAAGVDDLKEPFLVVMADHVMVVETIRDFLEKIKAHPDKAQLATDPDPEHVFDLNDATKVRTERGKIVAIAKDLDDFDAVDMGLFYFPQGSHQKIRAYVDAGARSVSDVVNAFIEDDSFFSAPLKEAVWQDVDTLEMAGEAEKRILKSMVKSNDCPISR